MDFPITSLPYWPTLVEDFPDNSHLKFDADFRRKTLINSKKLKSIPSRLMRDRTLNIK